jgi:hypothetical protein
MKISLQVFRDLVRPAWYWFYFRYFRMLEILKPPAISDVHDIPIIINNFNRLTYLRRLVDFLEKRGFRKIFILDNASTYPPLLDYYKSCQWHVFRLDKNLGHISLWRSGLIKKFSSDYFVYTDSDVVPVEECPDDFMEVFLDVLKKNQFARKVGFSLRIDNLPDHYRNKKEVIEWEKQYYERDAGPLLYRAPIDTTFALYRPRSAGGSNAYVPMFRTKYPYAAEHLPWYTDSNNLSEEDLFYLNTASTLTMWTSMDKKGT